MSSPRSRAGWYATLICALAAVAFVAWSGISMPREQLGVVEQEQARQAVQTPAEDGLAPDPAETDPAGAVRVPEFALWAPGTLIQTTDHYPQAGEEFTAQQCTVAFSFSNAQGRNFAVTAGHCGREGDLVWPTDAATAQDFAAEAGRFIYSGLYSPGADNVDVGVIEITDPQRTMELVGAPIETGLVADPTPRAGRVCKTGGTTGYTCGEFEESGRVQIITTDADQERETLGDIAAVCAAKGDSGGPVFREIAGRSAIIGVVSGTEAGRSGEECYEGMPNPRLMSYTGTEQMMRVISAVVPDALWVEQRW